MYRQLRKDKIQVNIDKKDKTSSQVYRQTGQYKRSS